MGKGKKAKKAKPLPNPPEGGGRDGERQKSKAPPQPSRGREKGWGKAKKQKDEGLTSLIWKQKIPAIVSDRRDFHISIFIKPSKGFTVLLFTVSPPSCPFSLLREGWRGALPLFYFTSICFKAGSSLRSILGRLTVSTPSLTLASIFSLSTSSGKSNVCSYFE